MSFDEWKKYKLGDIIEDVAMGPFGSNIKVENFIESGVPVIRGSNLNDGGLEDKHFVFISEAKANSLKRSLAFPDDLVFTHRGTLGQVGIIPYGKHPKYLVSQSQMRLTVDKKFLLPKFLFYFFKSKIGQYELLKNSSQVGVPAIASPTRSLKEVDITIPTLNSQTYIVSILSSLDEKIELNRQTNQTLETIAQTLFKEMCLPKGDELPEGWKIKKLKDAGNVICGKTPSTSNKHYFGGDIPFIKIPNMHNSVFIFKTEETLTKVGGESQKNKYVPAFSIVVSCIATVGLVSITSQISQTNQQINSIVPNNRWECYFLYFKMKSLGKILNDLGSGGSATLNVNTSTFSNIEIKVPEDKLLKKFHDNVNPLFEKILTNIQEIQTLTSIRDNLLPKLMKGEIKL